MPIRLYNSLTRKVEELVPRTPGHVDMFVCGPTVYDRIHLGNARAFTVFDVIAKWLRYRGLDVTYIQNITDIDDRIITRAAERSENALTYAHVFDDFFRGDVAALGDDAVTQFARATDHIPQVIRQVKALRDNGHVYLIDGDGWYFDLSTFPDYGKLSGRTGLQADDAVSRIDDSDKKRNTGDFCVWKLKKDAGEPSWPDTELGEGRPGWHIEDTAITDHFFGPQYDLHGGGMDLKFPHHEAEIAQQEAASGKVPFVRYWMHSGFLENRAQKMSKSLGNFMTLHEALQKYEPAVIRFYLLSNHYRAPLDFSEASLIEAKEATERLGKVEQSVQIKKNSYRIQSEERTKTDELVLVRNKIEHAMDEDFNTPAAFGAMFEFIRTIDIERKQISIGDAADIRKLFKLLRKQFGIVPSLPKKEIVELQRKAEEARKFKDYATADSFKDKAARLGWHFIVTGATGTISTSASPSPSPSSPPPETLEER